MVRIIFLIIIFSLFVPLGVGAAVLYLEPAESDYYQGDTFIINVRINVEEECVNTIQADLKFSKDSLEVKDVSQGNSIISFWVKEPEFSNENGFISFAGGIPGGFCGLLPGDPGESNLLGRIVFQARGIADAKVEFSDTSQVLLNDGLGTLANLSTRGAVLAILPGMAEMPKKEWQEALEKDKTPPEVFKIEINQDPATFEGKYFITFSTTDKQTGIDYYEVKEGRRDWQKIASPYLLENQGLKSIIKVRAADKAGNERVAQYIPPAKLFPDWLVVLVFMGIGVIVWISSKILQKK